MSSMQMWQAHVRNTTCGSRSVPTRIMQDGKAALWTEHER